PAPVAASDGAREPPSSDPGPRRARRSPPAPLPATHRATPAIRWQGTRNSRPPASATSHEPPDEREETGEEQHPAAGPLHHWVGRRRERRAVDPGNQPAGLERERTLVHFMQRRPDEW